MRILFLALASALLLAAPAGAQTRVLPAPQIDGAGTLRYPNGPVLGRYVGGVWFPTAPPPAAANDATNKSYVDGAFAAVSAALTARTVTNPTNNQWGVSFNPPTATSPSSYHNGSYSTVTASGNVPTNGHLLNMIVEPSYLATLPSWLSSPVAVGANIELQVKSRPGGDYWANLGVLDLQNSLGGQATSGIVRGVWSGTALAAGLRSQAENYAGRAQWGLIVGASRTGADGLFYDNSYAHGVNVHAAKTYGVSVGGLEGGNQATLPTYPFAVLSADETVRPWHIESTAESMEVNQYLRGTMEIARSTLPVLSFKALNAGTDQKLWQVFGADDGSFAIRMTNDAGTVADDALRFVRGGGGSSVGAATLSGVVSIPDTPSTGTAVAFLCIDASDRIFKKTSPCL